MADYLTFDVCDKRFTTFPWREAANFVRAKVMKEGLPIVAGYGDACPLREIDEAAFFGKSNVWI
jgi:hypothetical protein